MGEHGTAAAAFLEASARGVGLYAVRHPSVPGCWRLTASVPPGLAGEALEEVLERAERHRAGILGLLVDQDQRPGTDAILGEGLA